MAGCDNNDLRLIDSAAFGRPYLGERVSGDMTVIAQKDGLMFMAIVDVLGHGPDAHELAVRMQDYLARFWEKDLTTLMQQLHSQFTGERGAAAGLTVLDISSGELRYTGVGNTVIRRFGQRSTRLWSADGIIGNRIRRPVEYTLQVLDSDVVILYTDGVRDHFEEHEYPQLRYHRAQSVASNIVRKFGKKYDDASCLAFRYER